MSAMMSAAVVAGFTVSAATARGEFADRCPHPAAGGGVGRALEEQVGVAGVVGKGLAKGAQQLVEPVPVGTGQRPLGGRRHLLKCEPQQLIDEGVLAGELAVDGADAHAGPGGDLLHAGAGAGFAEHLTRGVDDAVVVADGAAPRDLVRVLDGGQAGVGVEELPQAGLVRS